MDQSIDNLLEGTGVLTQHEATAQLLDKFGLNWTVSKIPVERKYPDGYTGKVVAESDFFEIVRDDTGDGFMTCKKSYEPFQNWELVELVNKAGDNLGLHITRGGFFGKGGRVYVQLETGMLRGIGKNNDQIKKYVTGINGHNGAVSLRWGLGNVTISCENTFWAAAAEVEHSVKHTKDMRKEIEKMVNGMAKVMEAEKNLYDTFFKLADREAKKEDIQKVAKLVLDVDLSKTAQEQELSGYTINRLGELSGAINHEMAEKGETLWGLFSGVTKYTTHIMPGKREQSKAIGKGYEADNAVFKHFASLVN